MNTICIEELIFRPIFIREQLNMRSEDMISILSWILYSWYVIVQTILDHCFIESVVLIYLMHIMVLNIRVESTLVSKILLMN